jgi:hypothetical protein
MILICGFLFTLWQELGQPCYLEDIFGVAHTFCLRIRCAYSEVGTKGNFIRLEKKVKYKKLEKGSARCVMTMNVSAEPFFEF